MATLYDTSKSVGLDSITSSLHNVAKKADADLNQQLEDLKNSESGKLNPALLANVQHTINKWSLAFNLSGSASRAIKDLLAGVIQKI